MATKQPSLTRCMRALAMRGPCSLRTLVLWAESGDGTTLHCDLHEITPCIEKKA